MLYTKLKEIRKSKKLTLKTVGGKIGISASYLSQLESGKAEPSISTIEKLARFYEVATTYFFEESNLNNLNKQILVNEGKRKIILNYHNKVIYENLLGHASSQMEAICIKLSPDTKHLFTAMHHNGEEFIYVLKGMLSFTYNGTNYELKQGDCMHYDPSQPISFINDKKQEIEILAICVPPCGDYSLVDINKDLEEPIH